MVAVIVMGILAGLYLGTGLAQLSQKGLAFHIWVPRQQAEVGLFKNFMPYLSWAAFILPAIAALLMAGPPRWFFVAAAVLILVTLISTSLGEIPLNKNVFAWDPAQPIPGWEDTLSSWLNFHFFKASLAVAALAAGSIGLAQH